MAGRVNKRFVFGLVGAAVVVLGMGLFLFWKMVNKTGETHATVARQLETEGKWRQAEEAWGRAVGHEKTNLEWLRSWRSALENVKPRTKTEYQNFFAEYIRISKQIATVARAELEVAEEYLDIRMAFLRRLGIADRASVESISTEVESMLVWYPEGGALEDDRNRLRRYRGIAWSAIAGPASTLTREEIESAKADLAAALSADAGDGESARSLITLLDTQYRRAKTAAQPAQATALRQETRAVIDALLAAAPDDAWGRVTLLEFEIEEAESLSGAARQSELDRLRGELDAFSGWLTENIGNVDPRVAQRFALLEGVLDPEANAARTVAVYEAATEAYNNQSGILLQLAAAYNRSGQYDKAVEALETLEAQERLAVSVDGIMRMNFKQQAPLLLAEFTLTEMATTEDIAEKRRMLELARSARDRSTAEIGEDSPSVSMLDGQLAVAEAELAGLENDTRAASEFFQRALSHFARYNEQTEYGNTNGLWREGRVATQLNKTGLARDRFQQMLQIDPNNANVLLALAEVEEKLGTEQSLDKAYSLTAQARDLAPNSEVIAERLARLEKLTHRKKPEDPIEAAVFESERLLMGVDELAPDSLAAEGLMRDAWDEHPGDPRVAQQLVRVLMYSDRLDEAKTFVETASVSYPDEPRIATLAKRLEADSLLDIIIIGIDQSPTTPLNKLLEKIGVYRRYGEPELADQMLAEAEALAPDDADVVEQRFLQQISDGDLVAAEETADRAAAIDADRLGGLTYQARLSAAKGDHARSAEMLREAVAERATDAPLWRLLASQQVELGRINEAIASYRRALAITESDTVTIRGYVATLATQGRMSEALEEARRLKEFGERDPAFLDVYLRLEATEGGPEGLSTAISRRRQLMGERPFDTVNKIELANLYIENRSWKQAKDLLDQIEADSGSSLALVRARARWFADQGKVRNAEGGFEDGIDMARGAFVNYILSLEPAEAVDAYIEMARFMLQRGRSDVALRAIEEARPIQDPSLLRAEKLYGELMMSRNIPRAAAEAFQRVVDGGADDARDSYRKLLIEMLLRSNEFEAASAQIDALAAGNETDLTVLMQRADIEMFRGNSEEALRLVDLAIEKHPSNSLPFIKRAQYLMPNETLWRDAQRNLEEALRLSPNDPQAHKLMATMHYRQGRTDDAILSLRQSLASNPGQDAVFLGLLIELIDSDRAGEALDVANDVIAQRPTDAVLMLNASRVFSQRSEYDRANVLLERAWRLTKDSRVGLAYIQNLLASDPPKPQPANRVVAELEVLGADVNEDPVILAARANIEMKSGKPQRATGLLSRAYENSLENPGLVMQWFREVRRTLGDDDVAPVAIRYVTEFRGRLPAGTDQRDWLSYGLALLRIQDSVEIAEAESDLAALQAESGNDVIRRLSHRLLGSGRYGLEEYEAAAEAWRAGIEAFPDDWEMHNNLAYCVGIDLKRPAEGVPLARQAAQLAAGRADVYDTLGTLLIALGECDEAEDALLAARERQRTERERVTVLLNFARLALKCGTVDEAVRHWTEADTTVYTLPSLREAIGTDLDEVKAQIDSAQGRD